MRLHGRNGQYSLTHANSSPFRPRQEIYGCAIWSQRTAARAAASPASLPARRCTPLGGHTTIKLEQVRNVQGKPRDLYAMLLILLPCLISNPCNHPDLPNRRKVCYESGSCGCAGNWLASIPSCCLNYL